MKRRQALKGISLGALAAAILPSLVIPSMKKQLPIYIRFRYSDDTWITFVYNEMFDGDLEQYRDYIVEL